jgi:hypothetical protein
MGVDVSITIQPHRRVHFRQSETTAKRGSKLPRLGVLTVSEIGTAKTAKNLRALQTGA